MPNITYTNDDNGGGAAGTADLSNAGQVIDFNDGAATSQHDLRVPEVSALPADDSAFSMYRLVGHATLPNGIYWWNQTISQWVIS